MRKELIWKQRSKELWLKQGDKNTKFFHLSIIIRRRKNAINAIRNDANTWLTNPDEIGEFFIEKFKELYKTDEPDCPDNLENLINPLISEAENQKLLQIPTEANIMKTISKMPSLKTLGLDGMPAIFYKKKYWNIIKDTFILAVQAVFRTGHL